MQVVTFFMQILLLILQVWLLRGQRSIMANTARLIAAVAHLSTVSTSVVALIGSLASQIRDNVGDEAALNSLADTIESQASELAAAVTANTPADGERPSAGVGGDALPAGTAIVDDANGGDSGGETGVAGAENLPTAGDVVRANDATAESDTATEDATVATGEQGIVNEGEAGRVADQGPAVEGDGHFPHTLHGVSGNSSNLSSFFSSW
jgi:hypothetical protein